MRCNRPAGYAHLKAGLLGVFWLFVAAAGFFVLVRVSSDYLTTIVSLQEFRWSAPPFQPPSNSATRVDLALALQNQSNIDLEFKDLEVYLWLDDVTVGKTYGQVPARSVRANASMPLTVTIELDAASLREARSRNRRMQWHVTGTYMLRAPFADNDFPYRLALDLGT